MELSKADFDYVRALVHQRSAIVLEHDKSYLVEARLLTLARHEGFPSVQKLLSQLCFQPHGLLHQKVVEAMATNETSFFRDQHPFESLRTTLLPRLIQRRGADKCLNIWSAACSSGQEPYSIAMILREFRCALESWKVHLLASDLSNAMLERARAGIYSEVDANRGLPEALLSRHFNKQGKDWQIKEEVRRLVAFLRINLIEPWPALPQMDIIFLRNMLIYFDTDTKKRILANVRRVLRPDGYLFLGGAETTLNLDDAFERVQLDKVSCYCPRKII